MLCLDQNGHLSAGVSTSGPPFKTPGRVGDSPLPGCGLYADDMVCMSETSSIIIKFVCVLMGHVHSVLTLLCCNIRRERLQVRVCHSVYLLSA